MRYALYLLIIAQAAAVQARADEPLPVIATYELRKSQLESHAAARHPKGFWVSQIVGRIEDRKPMLDLKLKQPMTVDVSFVVARDGRLVSSTVDKSSGDAAIDKRAVDVLASAAPFPPMPEGLPDDSMSFTVPLRFK